MDSEKIKELCVKRGINIPILSERVGMSRAGLYTAIKNETLTVAVLEKIAEQLEVPITEFFGGGDSKQVTELNRKFYIIETIARDMRRILHTRWNIINETQEEKIKREASFDLLLIAAFETIIYFDTVPKSLAYYQQELRDYEEKYDKRGDLVSEVNDQPNSLNKK